MASGPTQHYEDASLGVWKGRPRLAATLRALIATVPVLLSVGLGVAAVHWFPPGRLGINRWVWLLAEMVCATVVLVVATKLARRLMPLTTLFRLTLYFPDRAPSRLSVAMTLYSPQALTDGPGVGTKRGLRPQDDHAARILALVAAIGDHDESTRGHSERVQAYSALIGKELGLSAQDAAKLSWAALLHDVGKLHVPKSVLSKPALPTPQEWTVLTAHPESGMEIAEPLRQWLGPWLDVIGQHHERWDGGGYPAGLSGEAISRGARIVAVADAYDAITSARSYKKALPASVARQELARCAGDQFDPQVVRAFLAIGLGRLHRVAGPLSVLSTLPGLPSLASDLTAVVQRVTAVAALKGVGAFGLALVVSAATAGSALAGSPAGREAPAPAPGGIPAAGTPGLDRDGGAPVLPGDPEAADDGAPTDPGAGTSARVAPGAVSAPGPSALPVGPTGMVVPPTDQNGARQDGQGGTGATPAPASSAPGAPAAPAPAAPAPAAPAPASPAPAPPAAVPPAPAPPAPAAPAPASPAPTSPATAAPGRPPSHVVPCDPQIDKGKDPGLACS